MLKNQIQGSGYMFSILLGKGNWYLSRHRCLPHCLTFCCWDKSWNLRPIKSILIIRALLSWCTVSHQMTIQILQPYHTTIQPTLLPHVMQVVYVCTGCDFISFFNGIGKASFLSTLFENCEFICSNSDQTLGVLTETYQFYQHCLSIASSYVLIVIRHWVY